MAKDKNVPSKDKTYAPQKLETIKQPMHPATNAQDIEPNKNKK